MIKKIKTFYSLIKKGNFSEIFLTILRKFVRITPSQIDVVDVSTYQEIIIPLPDNIYCRWATKSDLEDMFNNWPDSEEEYQRHKEVVYDFGFKKCCLLFKGGSLAYFRFLVTQEDLELSKYIYPPLVVKNLKKKDSVNFDWSYTFEKFRRQGLSIIGTDWMIKEVKNKDIKFIYSRRGMANYASIRMAIRTQFKPIFRLYFIQFFNQKKYQGFYIHRSIKN